MPGPCIIAVAARKAKYARLKRIALEHDFDPREVEAFEEEHSAVDEAFPSADMLGAFCRMVEHQAFCEIDWEGEDVMG